jgi:dipeptidyl aminopeptidase/acylaminoacyl peptidase
MTSPIRTATSAILLTLVPMLLAAQQRPVAPADYGQWESPGAATLSPDGSWLAYGINRVDETSELRVRRLDRDTTIVLPFATSARFTGDTRWLAYTIGPTPEEREKATEENPVRNRLGLLNLRTLEKTEVERVASFALSPDGHWIALRGYPPQARTSGGADLLVRNLDAGTTVSFGNAADYEWADNGALLALTIRTESGAGNGVQLYDPATGEVRVLDSSTALYRGLAWRTDARDLVVLRSQADSAFADTSHIILAWRGAGGRMTKLEFDPASAASFPNEMRIAEHRTPQWTDDGRSIHFGIRPRERAPERPRRNTRADTTAAADSTAPADSTMASDSTKTDENEVEISDVQVWHANDFRIMPMQKVQETRDMQRTLLAVWWPDDGTFVQAGTDLMESASATADGRFATETNVEPYRFDAMFGREFNDVSLIDLRSGERDVIIEKVRYFMGDSETGRYLLYFEGDDFFTYDTRTRQSANITGSLDAEFANLEYDYPVEQFPPYGIAGWAEDDEAVLLYDRYDVWRVAPDGSNARKLTDGARDSVVYRYLRTSSEPGGIALDEPLYFRITGEWTKKSGIARVRGNRAPERLVFEDANIGRFIAADSTQRFAYTLEDFDDSPDWFVAGADLGNARQVSETNPFQADFAWGRSELIDFTSETGRRLQGALLYPAGYEPGRRYPMIVYQYEIVSPGVHRYVVPSKRSYYNHAVFTANGYFVLLPDIVYRGRDPGRSAVEAIVPAVQTVVDRGLVDPARVGLAGHSWGGYQATYVPTQTNIFAASVAGAPLTNFLSMMGAIHWSGGLPETGHWETGQARMGVPYWEDFDAHVRNSPAAFIDKLETPMLMMFGDEDGTVDWHQGVEFYNFARRAGKTDFVLLVYPGEDHGLRQEKNQVDYQRRILEWFGHWLKGEPAPPWITDGVSWLERKKKLDAAGGNGK